MGAFMTTAVGLVTLAAVGLAWLLSVNQKMKGIPAAALKWAPRRWEKAEMLETYKRVEETPIDWTPHLPPKLDRRYVVTGGYGNVGGQMVLHLLARGQSPESIRIIELRPGVNRRDMQGDGPISKVGFVQADISSREAVEAAFAHPWPASVAALPMTVFHPAALIDPGRRTQWTYSNVERANVNGTRHVLDASRAAGADVFIYTCSSSVNLRPVNFWSNPFRQWYDGCVQVLDESDFDEPLRDRSQFYGNYAYSKAIAERLVCEANSPEFRTGSIRPGNCIYGSSECDQVIGFVLRKGSVPTWMPNIIQNFVHAGHVSLGHLCFEAALLNGGSGKGKELPKCAGRPFVITDAGAPPAFMDVYNLLKLTSSPPGRVQVQALQPGMMLAISYVVEMLDVASHMPLLRYIVPRPTGDLASLQPAVFSPATHTPALDELARRSVAEGGLGFKHVCSSMEGIVQQIADWNRDMLIDEGKEKKSS
ncbi:sterol-4alpha-carboxylate 3-dehydrogenase (decarboxylating) [Microdochium nivale]|nr:sterol-4alpha-carboxylate 3-dehydrogenase (decarboxylating) [Microdochium nivale]